MNTATCPSLVMVVVRSVPHIVSTVSGMMVPSWVRRPRGTHDPRGCEQIVLAHPALGRADASHARAFPLQAEPYEEARPSLQKFYWFREGRNCSSAQFSAGRPRPTLFCSVAPLQGTLSL